MFKQVICKSCEGNGCVNCCRNGVVYKEIDDPTLALHDEIAELKLLLSKDAIRLWNENESLKRQLEIAKEALKMIKSSHPPSDMTWIIAQESLEELESAGE